MQIEKQSKNLFEIILKVASFTHQSVSEIKSWTQDEIELALEFVVKQEQNQASNQLAIIDYHLLMSRQFDKKQQAEAKTCQKQAQQIREILTGYKPKKTSNLDKIKQYVSSSR